MRSSHHHPVQSRPPVAMVGLLVLAATFWGCGGPDPGADADAGARKSTLESVRERGVVRVGYANEAPYAYRDSATGRLTGEAPEIARVILADLGVEEIEGVLTEFGSLIPGLQAGRFDVIAAGMYILPERCKQIAFSNPTYAIGEAFVVRVGNPKRLHSYEDILNDSTATLGVVSGAVQRDYARTVGIPENRVIVFPDAPSAVAGVEAGRVDAYGGTSLTVQDLLDKTRSGELERADPFTGPAIDSAEVRGYGAFGFRKADNDLREAVNAGLAEYIGSPEHLELVRPFGFTDVDLPGGVTAEELCARR
jgi:polar amino acid transport system substrate-binding protein